MCLLELKIGSNSIKKCICSIEPLKLNYIVKYSTLVAPLMQSFFFLKALEESNKQSLYFCKGCFMFSATIFMFGTNSSRRKYRLCVFYVLDSSGSLIPKSLLHPQICVTILTC